MGSDQQQRLKNLPSIDVMLLQMPEEISTWGRSQVTESLRSYLSDLRASILDGQTPDTSNEHIRQTVIEAVSARHGDGIVSVFNLTGTVIHTNLGRANLAPEAINAVTKVAGGPSTLEFDLESGERGSRDSHIESLICDITGAEAATAVNNGAAAVLLVLNTLALGKKVPVSRGELVEIGGSFRIPEVMNRAGCTLTEVGATNRTHRYDFADAIDDDTALLMKVHTSNFKIDGFTKAVPDSELSELAKAHDVPFVIDLGSGNLADFAVLGLPNEPTVRQALEAGADLVTFSGDKLLGGPQAGLIAGRADLIRTINKNPLKRALRLDKMTVAALSETLKLYRNPDNLAERLPTFKLLTKPASEIRAQAEQLLESVRDSVGDRFDVTAENTMSQIGSGSLPLETLPSASIRIASKATNDSEVRDLAKQFRRLPKPVIGRMHKQALWLDCRCLADDQVSDFIDQLTSLTQ